MLNTTSVTQKGQVTIPINMRRVLGLTTGQSVQFTLDDHQNKRLILEPASDFSSFKGSFKSNKMYSKKLARKAYLKEVIKGKI